MQRFPEFIQENKKRQTANSWLKELKSSSDEGKIIAHNWKSDHRIVSTAGKFISNLMKNWTPGESPKDVIETSITEDCLFNNDNVTTCQGELLSHVESLDSFEKFHLNSQGAFTDGLKESEIEEIIEDISISELGNEVKNRREIVWCTETEKIEGCESGDKLRNVLGLTKIGSLADTGPIDQQYKKNRLVELQYLRGDIEQSYIPTVMEAGYSPAFKPSEEGSKSGITVDLQTGEEGVSEYVHKPISANKVKKVQYRGTIDSDPPTKWIRRRLKEIGD